MNRLLPLSSGQEGFALVLALFVATAVLILAMNIMTVSMMSQEASGQTSVGQQAFQVADGGAEMGLNWLKAQSKPPELDPTLLSKVPMSAYTDYSSGLNPAGTAFPQVRYRVSYVRLSPVTEGMSLTVGETYTANIPYWHYYKVVSQSRSERTVAMGKDRYDRCVIMSVRRLYLH